MPDGVELCHPWLRGAAFFTKAAGKFYAAPRASGHICNQACASRAPARARRVARLLRAGFARRRRFS